MNLKNFVLLEFPLGSVGATAQRFVINRDKRGLSPYSVRHLCDSLAPFCAAYPALPIGALTARAVRGYVANLHVRYAPRTVKGVATDLRQFLRWCAKKGLVSKKVWRAIPKIKVKARDKSAEAAAVAHLARYLASQLNGLVYRDFFGNLCWEPRHLWSRADRLHLRDLMILVMLWESGARRGEMCTVGVAAVARGVKEAHGRAVVLDMLGKTGVAHRWFTMASMELVRAWLDIRPLDSEYLIYSDRTKNQMTPGALSLMLARRCKEAGLTPFRSHALRHLAVKRFKQTVGLELANAIVDHTEIGSTVLYGVATEGEVATAVAAVGWKQPLF